MMKDKINLIKNGAQDIIKNSFLLHSMSSEETKKVAKKN